jgi:hypothetical protein
MNSATAQVAIRAVDMVYSSPLPRLPLVLSMLTGGAAICIGESF